jgi:hypothetical protein
VARRRAGSEEVICQEEEEKERLSKEKPAISIARKNHVEEEGQVVRFPYRATGHAIGDLKKGKYTIACSDSVKKRGRTLALLDAIGDPN